MRKIYDGQDIYNATAEELIEFMDECLSIGAISDHDTYLFELADRRLSELEEGGKMSE